METDAGLGYFATHIQDRGASGFDYFSKEKIENFFSRTEIVEIKPINNLTSGPIWFQIGSFDSNYFIPLDGIRAEIELSVVKNSGENLGADDVDKIAYVNYLGVNLFENINVKLNGVAVSDHSRLHQLKSTLQLYYSYGKMGKKYNQTVDRYSEETFTNTTAVDTNCVGFQKKKSDLNNSKRIFVNFLPLIDLSSGLNYLCKGHELFLEFERGKDSWALLTAENDQDLKIVIHDFKLQVQCIFPNPEFNNSISRKIANSSIHYNFTRNVMRTFQIYTGSAQVSWNNIFLGQLPRAMYFLFLDNDQISGNIKNNPHTWLPYNVNTASVTINGYRHPAASIKYGPVNKHSGYRWFLDNMGLQESNDDLGISLENYYKSKFIIPFDLTHRRDNGFVLHSSNSGSVNFNCTFSEATTKPLSVICYAIFDNSIEIDTKKEIKLDYQI